MTNKLDLILNLKDLSKRKEYSVYRMLNYKSKFKDCNFKLKRMEGKSKLIKILSAKPMNK